MGLNLTATNHILELVTTGSGAVHVVASYTDNNAGTKTAGSQTTIISSATTTTIISAPGASITREVTGVNVEAVAGNTVTVQKDVAGTDHQLIGPAALTTGQRIEFTSAAGWRKTDATGVVGLPTIADDTFLANISGATAAPSAVALTTLAGAGLTGGANAVLDIGAGTGITVNANDVQLATIAADSFFANGTGSPAVATAIAGATVAGAGLTYTTGGILAVGSSTSITVNANDIQRSALTGDITAAANANATAFRAFASKTVLGNDTGSSAVPTDITVHQELDWVSAVAGNWLFDGSNDFVDFGNFNSFDRTNAFTLSIWTDKEFYFGKSTITSTQQGYFISHTDGAVISFRLNNNIAAGGTSTLTVNSTGNFTFLSRTHVCVTYDGTSASTGLKMYVNGSLITIAADPDGITSTSLSTAHLCLGAKEDGSSAKGGHMEHASIFTVALTAAQVLEVYGGGTPPDLFATSTAPDPVFWCKMDSTDTTAAGGVIDYGTGAHNGTAAGGLAPSVAASIGTMLVRGTSLWQLISPGSAGLALVSNGTSAVPTFQPIGSLGALPAIAADSFLGNFTGSTDVPTALAGATVAGAGLTYTTGGILAVGSSTSIAVNANDIQRAALTGAITASVNSNTTAFGTLAAKSVLANSTNATAVPAALAGSAAFQYLRVNSANTALEWATLSGHASTSITYTTDQFQRAALTGDVTATANVNTTAFRSFTAKSVLANSTNAGAVPTELAGAGALTYLRVNSGNTALEFGTLPATTVTPTEVTIFGTPTNTGVPFMVYVTFSAGTPGTPDDVTVFSSSIPFNFRILEAWLVTLTAVASSTVQARTAVAGGGSSLTTAMSSTVAGKTSDNSTATTAVAIAGSIFLRRSDRGVAGEFFMLCIKT